MLVSLLRSLIAPCLLLCDLQPDTLYEYQPPHTVTLCLCHLVLLMCKVAKRSINIVLQMSHLFLVCVCECVGGWMGVCLPLLWENAECASSN